MPKSRNRKEHKEKLNTRKEKMNDQVQDQQQSDVRGIPTWDANELLEVYGAEFAAIQEYIASVPQAYAAVNSILNRNCLNGKVTMKFEKPDANGNFVELTPEEAAPHEEQFQNTLNEAKRLAKEAIERSHGGQFPEPPSQEGLPRIDAIVDQTGTPVADEDKGNKPNLIVVP